MTCAPNQQEFMFASMTCKSWAKVVGGLPGVVVGCASGDGLMGLSSCSGAWLLWWW